MIEIHYSAILYNHNIQNLTFLKTLDMYIRPLSFIESNKYFFALKIKYFILNNMD